MGPFRHVLGYATATVLRILSLGRIRGLNFTIRKPSLLRVYKGARLFIGAFTHIEPGARIVIKADTEIGENVYVGKNATLVAFSPLRIGSRTLIGENVSIHTENHGPVGRRMEFTSAAVSIGDDVWIGAGSVITSGVTVGGGSTIGANAVVTHDIPNHVLAVGVPAEIRKKLV